MLSQKVKEHLKNQGWWFEDASKDYKNELSKLDIKQPSDICQFYSHAEDGSTFYSRKKEIYQLGWFILNSNYELDLKRSHDSIGLSEKYIPLDSFEGESGFFYNKETGEVVQLTLGQELEAFLASNFKPQWGDFNSFIQVSAIQETARRGMQNVVPIRSKEMYNSDIFGRDIEQVGRQRVYSLWSGILGD